MKNKGAFWPLLFLNKVNDKTLFPSKGFCI
jgi:hypothetical protein